MKTRILLVLTIVASVVAVFQNCSQVGFEGSSAPSQGASLGTPDDPVEPTEPDPGPPPVLPPPICNPLDGQGCDSMAPSKGLVGNLYYLTAKDHGDQFDGDLNKALIGDYIEFGHKVLNPVIMSQINVSPRGWDTGFRSGDGEVVRNNQGEKLFEWFALDLHGYIELPAGETYQLAQISDDGMRVTIGEDVVLNDDGVHAPRWKCSSLLISGGVKLPIQVRYFQGPRVEIAMQLLVRPASKLEEPCSADGGFEEIPAEAFSN